MLRKRTVKSLPSDSSEDDEPLSKLTNSKRKPSNQENDSSSESDIENYLQHPDKIDLDSPFFNLPHEPPSFDKIEKNILSGVSRLSDSEPEDESTACQKEARGTLYCSPSTSKVNFGQLHEYAKKMEEAKRKVEEYNARKRAQNKETNIENLLAAGEAKGEKNIGEENLHSSDFESFSDSEKEGWEEVQEEKEKEKSVIPKEGLEIRVDMPGTVKKKKKEVDLLAAIKRRINRVRKENQLLVHKVHLLCWIAHGNYVSSQINSENVLAVALSLLPSENSYPDGRADLNYLEQILKWFRNAVENVEKKVPEGKSLEELLQAQITKKEAFNKKMLVYIFVAILRSLGIHCRLVLSFQVEPLRPPNSELLSLSANAGASESKEENAKRTKSKNTSEKVKEKDMNEQKSPSKSTNEIGQAKVNGSSKSKSEESQSNNTKVVVSRSEEKNKNTKRSKSTMDDKESQSSNTKEVASKSEEAKKKNNKRSKSTTDDKIEPSKIEKEKSEPKTKNGSTSTSQKNELKPKDNTRSKSSSQQSEPVIPQVDGANDPKSSTKPNLKKLKQKEPPCPVRNHPKRLKTITKYKDSDSGDEFSDGRSPFSNKSNDSPKTNGANLKKLRNRVPKSLDVRNDVLNLVKKSIKEQKDVERSRTVAKRKSGHESENDSDYVPQAIKKKHRESADEFTPKKLKVKKRVQVKKNNEEEETVKRKLGMDVWAEVYLENEEKWVSVDVVKGQLHCVNELCTRASHPVSYIVAWNNDNTLKDLTRRYCTNFNTVTRKLRIDATWWEETLKHFAGRKTARDKEEDEELERQQLEKPLPTSIAEYKNHPLYVLKRHLLKFEALYPPDAPTLGFVRNEPVYSRQCVYTLHSRDIWLKHAKVVKLGEQPYKIVKARPRWDKLSNSIVTGELLEIFGPWQTQDYEPPTAENGIVPRNAFGNVELFKPCMLPKKTVHLKLPGLNKVAKRMNIDCAPALVGFDFHGGWNHPTYDGFIVCEEFADILVAAWDVEQEEIEKREQEKIDKRVYGNWKRLIKGLLIRERLKAKYEFGEPSGGGKAKKKSLPKLSTKKRKVESDSDSN